MQRGKTGHGYVYYRDRSNGDDVTVYEHQIMALLDNDPALVFSPDTDVHHECPARDLNAPEILEVVDKEEHRSNGGDKWGIKE